MTRYLETLQAHARLTILRLLDEAPRYTSNVSMLTQLMHPYGITYTRDQVTTEVHWLKEQGFVSTEDHNGFIIVTATARGIEIAHGIATHPGVQRPRPGA